MSLLNTLHFHSLTFKRIFSFRRSHDSVSGVFVIGVLVKSRLPTDTGTRLWCKNKSSRLFIKKKNVTKRGEIKDVHSFYFILAVSTNIMQSNFELVVIIEFMASI